MADAYDAKVKHCSVIAKPLAPEKLCKKVLKLCKKATKKKQVKRGVKEVVKAIRKKVKGCATAANMALIVSLPDSVGSCAANFKHSILHK